jgi:hypothetical protein
MKSFRLFSNPYLLIFSFLLILISGQHFGGFYLLYLLLALPHGGVHSLLAIGGVLILLITHLKFKWVGNPHVRLIGSVSGALLLVASLAAFFINDRKGYNDQTFEQFMPLATLLLFGYLSLMFIALNCFHFMKHNRSRGSALPVNSH